MFGAESAGPPGLKPKLFYAGFQWAKAHYFHRKGNCRSFDSGADVFAAPSLRMTILKGEGAHGAAGAEGHSFYRGFQWAKAHCFHRKGNCRSFDSGAGLFAAPSLRMTVKKVTGGRPVLEMQLPRYARDFAGRLGRRQIRSTLFLE
jgi:hypothetical protein